jgi:threonine dehydratase
VEVGEDAIAEAVRIYFDDTHQIAEGAGAAPLAAVLQERERLANKKVGVILTGGNIERARLMQIFGGVTPSAA